MPGKTLDERIDEIKRLIIRLQHLPPALGEKWREGMIRHYWGILNELCAHQGKPIDWMKDHGDQDESSSEDNNNVR